MEDLLSIVKAVMTEKMGECVETDGGLRSVARNVGYFNGMAIIEASLAGFRAGAKNAWPVLQIYSTLAQNVEDRIVPVLKEKLFDLNSTTLLGSYGYYAPLKQIYHCYRIPVNMTESEDIQRTVSYCFDQIRRQLDAFADYVMILAEDPQSMTLTDYIIGTHADVILEECVGILNSLSEEENQGV